VLPVPRVQPVPRVLLDLCPVALNPAVLLTPVVNEVALEVLALFVQHLIALSHISLVVVAEPISPLAHRTLVLIDLSDLKNPENQPALDLLDLRVRSQTDLRVQLTRRVLRAQNQIALIARDQIEEPALNLKDPGKALKAPNHSLPAAQNLTDQEVLPLIIAKHLDLDVQGPDQGHVVLEHIQEVKKM